MWVQVPPAAPADEGEFACRASPPDVARCVDPDRLGRAYAYLLGLYLGDGMLTLAPRNVWRLRISMDAKYPELLARAKTAILEVADRNGGEFFRTGCIELSSNWKHWRCLFPQHGPGPKHSRPIRLETWQLRVIIAIPEAFISGLIHSDGCRSMNRVKGYAYPRYFFSNKSDDIRSMFSMACRLVGVEWRESGNYVSVARRQSVAILDKLVQPKR